MTQLSLPEAITHCTLAYVVWLFAYHLGAAFGALY